MSHPGVRGFSLLELMVAIAISLLLLMGVIALFVSSRASYETTERLSRVQENGRFALEQITTDVRATGYQGCARAVNTSRRVDYAINQLNNPNALLWNFPVVVQGFDGRGNSFAPALNTADFQPAPSPNGDVLVLRIPRRQAQALYTTAPANPSDPLPVPNVNPAPLAAGDIAMITDCEARAWFQVTAYGGGMITHDEGGPEPGNASGSLLHPFKANSQVIAVDTVIYYLAPSEDNPERMSLWRKTGANPSDEIADGIERLEVQYGFDGPGGFSYVDASAVTNWDNVSTVQIAVLARAPDAYGNDLDTMEHVLFAAPVRVTAGPFNDRFQRKVFTATVAVRNQIIS
jgi:type IV pilus assembly protein PilW